MIERVRSSAMGLSGLAGAKLPVRAPEDNRKTRVLARVWPIWLRRILTDCHPAPHLFSKLMVACRLTHSPIAP
jgi:hypothetical protein